MKPLLALALLAVAACGPPPSGLSPDDAYAQAQQAIADHDAETARALLVEAAAEDHLPSLKLLLQGYERGFVVPGEWNGTEPVTLPVDAQLGQVALTGFRFVRAINRGARKGDPEALLEVATSHTAEFGLSRDGVGDPERTQTHRDSALAIYHRIADQDVDPLRLAMLAGMLGEDEGHRRHLRVAAAAGDPMACAFEVWNDDEHSVSISHMAGVARYLDRFAQCAPDRPLPGQARWPLRELRTQLDLGTPEATIALDSLRQLGVFERHPELVELVGDRATPASTS